MGHPSNRPQTPAWCAVRRLVSPLACALALLAAEVRAQAQSSLPHEDCQEPTAARRSCTTSDDCNEGLRCIRDGEAASGTCRVPCVADPERPDPSAAVASLCGYGEACVTGEELGGRETRYCKPVPFAMDLNLLDSCIYHFVEGLQPVGAGDSNTCSLTRNLAAMLDRDGAPGFSIFDLDLCIQDFLAEEPEAPCEDGSCLYCEDDATCGRGAFCNLALHRCQRECGRVVDRGSEDGEVLERVCAGRMKICEESRGRCKALQLGGQRCERSAECPRGGECVDNVCEEVPLACQLDVDCPSGAYCFMGECQPRCYRATDCPDSNWFCSADNRCERKPAPNQPAGFDPGRYNILFGRQAVKIDGINSELQLPLLIMDTDSGRAVFGDGNILFAYRLQVTYDRKQDPICVGDLQRDELTDKQRADCVISPEEEFLILDNPFGTVYGDGRQGLGVQLNQHAAERLTPGRYQARIRAVFSNGSSTTMSILYDKPTPDGRYSGLLEIGVDDPRANLVAVTDAALGLRIHMDQERTWDQVLDDNHLIDLAGGASDEREFRDITFGYLVEGAIYGNRSLVFNRPDATSEEDNEIPIRGLYSPQLRRLRLISVVDTPADAEWCRDGGCTLGEEDSEQLRVRNVFRRDIRRKIEWIGTFDALSRTFEGTYRETLTGLFPHAVTLQGGFRLVQTVQDSSLRFAHGPLDAPLLPEGGWRAVGFPDRAQLYSAFVASLDGVCGDQRADLAEARAHFSAKGAFARYLASLDRAAVFPKVFELGGRVGEVLNSAGGAALAETTASIADLLRDAVRRCADDPDAELCVDVEALQCGLALHAKALLAGDEPADDAPRCDRSDQCGGGVCVYDPAVGDGRCRAACDGPRPDLCAADELCTAGETVEGTGDHYCKPAFGGWVNRAQVMRELTSGEGESTRIHTAPIFCDRRAQKADENCRPAAQAPNLAALQEYAWFYKTLHETLAFEAGQAISDAFFQLYRDEYISGSGALDMTAAYHDKVRLLKRALARYGDARDQMFSPITAQVLFDWPMAHFTGQGEAWLDQMHAVLNDRAEALYELVDLQRRVIRQDMSSDELFYNHVFQQEYLSQVYLAVLQAHWQGPQFAYAGQGPMALSKAQQILSRVSEVNNPLGLRPNRTYFENVWNSGVSSNVELFRQRAAAKLVTLIGEDGRGGLIALSKEALRTALQQKQQLISDLDDLGDQLEDELLRLCGEDTPLPDGCGELSGLDRTLKTSCVGPDCAVTYQCEDPRCERVARLFNDTLDATLQEVACRADTPLYKIYKNPTVDKRAPDAPAGFIDESDLESRLCVRGEMGALLQERASLELTRQSTLRQVEDLIRQLAIKADMIRQTEADYAELNGFLATHEATMTMVEQAFAKSRSTLGTAEATAYSADCITIGGTAAGDSCAVKSAAGTALGSAKVAAAEAGGIYQVAKLAADIGKTVYINGFERDSKVNGIKSDMDSLTSQVESLIGQYQSVVQQMQSVNTRIADTLTVAQSRWNAFNDEIEEVAARLTGQDSRWALLRNSAAMQAQQAFRGLLREVYKLVQAVTYRYDISEGEAQALRNSVYKLVTAGQVQAFLADLDCRLGQFAADNGLDGFWDSPADSRVFVMSLRKALFPTLTDIVNPDTGAVLTADEQFHRIITSPPYLRTELVNGVRQKRIVIPFATWMDVRAVSDSGTPALVSRNTCNHVLVGDATREAVAVNFETWNARKDNSGKYQIHGWLGRGTTDHMRSCSERYPVSNAPVVQTYTFGNAYRDSDVPLPNQETLIQGCVDQRQNLTSANPGTVQGLTCWSNGFRERSLGSPSWVLIIDSLGAGEDNAWILEPVAPGEGQPVIRDIDVAFRYTTRGMGETTFQCDP